MSELYRLSIRHLVTQVAYIEGETQRVIEQWQASQRSDAWKQLGDRAGQMRRGEKTVVGN